MSRRLLILVVDDNPLNLELATEVLGAAGYGVRQAASGPEALKAARVQAPDLVLMDIGLPGMDGYAALQAFRADPALAALPVVALTASAMAGDAQRAIEAGFDGYLTKPIDTKTFGAAVREILTTRGARP